MTETSRSLLARFQAEVLSAWQRGWQPAELVRVVRRQTTARHAALVIDAIAAQMRDYAPATVDERWSAQLAELDATVAWDSDDTLLQWWADREGLPESEIITIAKLTMVRLQSLPRLPFTGPLPGQHRPGRQRPGEAWAGRTSANRHDRPRDEGGPGPQECRPADERMLARVRALLAKAESTTFPEEAEAYTAKAQELMARYSIDHALLMARIGGGDEPGIRRIFVDNPYEAQKTLLLQAVAGANRCRCVWAKDFGFATILGFPADLDAVELLFTSLLVQGVRAMALHRTTTASFRRAFLAAYAHRIGERLNQAAQAAQTQACREEDLLPVLSRRENEVQTRFRAEFPAIRTQRITVSNGEGWAEGRAAADRAVLHGRAAVRAKTPSGRE
jgi:hypothetical protein